MSDKDDRGRGNVGRGDHAVVEAVGGVGGGFGEVICRRICERGELGEDLFVGFRFEFGPSVGFFGV